MGDVLLEPSILRGPPRRSMAVCHLASSVVMRRSWSRNSIRTSLESSLSVSPVRFTSSAIFRASRIAPSASLTRSAFASPAVCALRAGVLRASRPGRWRRARNSAITDSASARPDFKERFASRTAARNSVANDVKMAASASGFLSQRLRTSSATLTHSRAAASTRKVLNSGVVNKVTRSVFISRSGFGCGMCMRMVRHSPRRVKSFQIDGYGSWHTTRVGRPRAYGCLVSNPPVSCPCETGPKPAVIAGRAAVAWSRAAIAIGVRFDAGDSSAEVRAHHGFSEYIQRGRSVAKAGDLLHASACLCYCRVR